jgi:hypothetical protein
VSQVDVRALGYRAWHVRESEIESGVSVGQLHFLSDHRLVVTFTSHILLKSLPRRGQPDVSASIQLRALFVDAQTGQVQATRVWPTSSERSRILPVDGGKFIVITPDKLTLYSATVQPQKELVLPVSREAIQTWWDAVPSPAGTYVLVWYDPPGGDWVRPPPTMSALIDTETLQAVLPWAGRGNGLIPLDDGDVITGDGHTYPVIGRPSGPWRPIPAPWRPGCKPTGLVMAVTNRAIFAGNFIPTDRYCYSLALTTGEILFEREFPEHEFVGLVGTSAGGQSFAVETVKVHGSSWLLDIGGRALVYRIKVYDIPERRWIYTLDGKKQGIKSISGLALSPDGSLLALIDQNGILQVYRLPPESSGESPGPPQ